jgi:ribosomal protein L37E
MSDVDRVALLASRAGEEPVALFCRRCGKLFYNTNRFIVPAYCEDCGPLVYDASTKGD